ncbi:hypothetical protein C2845_PM02G08360 [Panicum miliaceum]|uniref:Uncharacterized protein n=1 Tax=Panicum miliaceum TaxID=4540 RepID=A0A3L6S8R8_PANMI|nr:hypothetical protein C2845_PM02G08360 [Panicum miliaceum]
MAGSAAAAPPEEEDPQTLARWYQLEALERAVAGNTVAFLETGAGKTLIAVLLLRAYAHRLRSAPPPSFAVFLVPTVVLVSQQARVIEAHTDLRVDQFYGEMGVDLWRADTWRAAVDGAEVLVMTPQILLDNLRHSFFRLRDIALLIFDECHHANGNSPYARILKEFYHPQLNSRPSDPIPRIFGMTASLINSKGLQRASYSVKISDLENLMNAKVYTVDSESALSQYIPFAKTRIVQYDDSSIPSELYSHTTGCLKKLEAKAAEVLQTYKESCLSFWGEKLDEKAEGFVRNYAKDVYNDLSETISKMTERGTQRHIGEDFAADLQDGLLTSKVHFLIKSLLEYRHMQDLRCILFVERVITSIVLESLLSTIHQMSGWTVRYMAGSQQQCRNKHMEIIDSFRRGKVVCLKACRELHAIGALTDALLPELTVLEDEPDIDYVTVTMRYVGIIHLNQEQVIVARRFQTTILSLIISNDHLEVGDSIKNLLEMPVSPGVVYLLLPVVAGKIDWCSIKFSASPMLEATNKDIRRCHSCKDTDFVQTKDGPLCRHGLDLTCEDQPLLAASKILKVRNFLQKGNCQKPKETSNRNAVELPPELCIVVMSPLSAHTLYSFSFIPSIMYRIQCMLLSVKLKSQLGPIMQQFDIPSLKILEALTTKKCQEEFSQESLETLGDSFLKYIATQHLFSKYKHQHEGMLTKMKKNLISNAALCQLACSNNLVGYIRSEPFNPETWIIPGLGYDTCGSSKIVIQSPNMYSLRKLKLSIKSKRIADSVEALIGAYLSAAGEQGAYVFMKSLGMDIEFHNMPIERKVTIKSEVFINRRSLEEMLGYDFNDPSLLVEALTHGDIMLMHNGICPGMIQRLEFLGDAVLDHIFTDYFYHQYPECTPELLTDLRSASVNNYCYAHAAVKAGLHKHILHLSSALYRRMADYLDTFKQSFSGPSYGWEAGIGLPKVLGDVIESIAGAIYVDSKCDKEIVWRSMKRLLEPLATPDTLEMDPVKELHEFCASRAYSIMYTVTHDNRVSSVVAEVQTKGTAYKATQTGITKDDAKKLAAKAVLQDMKAADGMK